MIQNSGHASVIEHVSASMLFVTDRGVSHEIVRHRLASYSQESTRYVSSVDKKQFKLSTDEDCVEAYQRGLSMRRAIGLERHGIRFIASLLRGYPRMPAAGRERRELP